jgi:CRP/FNR family transcriptional regulator, nitrogen oxide reductase regulator
MMEPVTGGGDSRASLQGKRRMNIPVAAFLRERKPRFFEGLDTADIRTILAAGTQQRFSADSVIHHQGDLAGHLFLLLTGRVRRFFLTEDGQKVVLLRVPPGEIFGEATVLATPANYLVSSEAIIHGSTLVWSRRTIRGFCERYPRLVENALLISFDYLAAYRAIHASLICNSAPQRLAQVLANLAEGIGQKVPGGVELDVRNEELANEANISPFTASRLLSAWQREGILVKRRGKVFLRAPGRLLRSEITTSAALVT